MLEFAGFSACLPAFLSVFDCLLASLPACRRFCRSLSVSGSVCLSAGLSASLPAFLPVSVCLWLCLSVCWLLCQSAGVSAGLCLSAACALVYWAQPLNFFLCLPVPGIFRWWSHCYFTLDLCCLHLPCFHVFCCLILNLVVHVDIFLVVASFILVSLKIVRSARVDLR